MNLKMPSVIRASLVITLLLPLAGCGNKGPLVLPQNPPAENAPMEPTLPPMGETLPLDGVPEDDAPAPTDDVPALPPTPPPVPAASDNGNG